MHMYTTLRPLILETSLTLSFFSIPKKLKADRPHSIKTITLAIGIGLPSMSSYNQ